MDDKLIKEAYKLRYLYFNVYEGKENKWHEKYKDNKLYDVVVKSFEYDFKLIGQKMPELLEEAF